MTSSDFQVRGVDDPRLAAHAASPLPTWLWAQDGTRIAWANPAGARLFGATDEAALAARMFGPADGHRRQIARLAHQLPATGAVRLERLRGFGAAPGMLMTCACARLVFADGKDGVLITAMDPAARTMPLIERPYRAAIMPAPDAANADACAPPAPEPATREPATHDLVAPATAGAETVAPDTIDPPQRRDA
ncbi:MAG: PAS domain-containing sensor histidine kinase, partial [Phreatobacter sp.]